MNRSITKICSCVTVLDLSLSSMKVVVKAPSSCPTLIKEWGHNIAPYQHIKEWESSTFSLTKFFRNCVDVVEPVPDCTANTGKHYTAKIFHKSTICNQWYYNIRFNSSYSALFHTTSHTLDHVVSQLLISFFCSINTYRFT